MEIMDCTDAIGCIAILLRGYKERPEECEEDDIVSVRLSPQALDFAHEFIDVVVEKFMRKLAKEQPEIDELDLAVEAQGVFNIPDDMVDDSRVPSWLITLAEKVLEEKV